MRNEGGAGEMHAGFGW